MITYLVSGDADIRPSDENLRRSGRRVRFDREVALVAADELRAGRRYVVVAHGRVDGTVLWFDSVAGANVNWLWVGMPSPPREVRLYLYSCNAGVHLARHFRNCECFGHAAPVPMPTNGAASVVLDFLTRVDQLIDQAEFDANSWRQTLAEYVNDEWERELEERTSFLRASALQMLSQSLSW